MSKQHRGQPVPDRARKRAIRAQASKAGVAYSVAVRQLEAASMPGALAVGETRASEGRTLYPPGADTHRQWLIQCRERRTADQWVDDTRRAAELPLGRARHLVERFPPSRGLDGTGVGPLYHGEGLPDALALLYRVIAAESPELLPAVGDLAWMAEMGEETAVDAACAYLDRAARLLLDVDTSDLWSRIEAALVEGQSHPHWRVRADNARLRGAFQAVTVAVGWYDGEALAAGLPVEGMRQILLRGAFQAVTVAVGWYDGEALAAGLPVEGMRQILDALLIVGDDGHAAGTRVRMLSKQLRGRPGTIIGALWGPHGPPTRYRVHVDGLSLAVLADPYDLVVLAGQSPL
jgi:hypothetical protein